ncbi:unnamed protein product [Ostreobium quekettii]|uniref:BRCT domain-containing protein n=1 Tax=Ostreobium quekettii TaxID=121088 RepID=A0A8S1IRD7_9CHLO|nr:unnamed protein product [Ostreobium quekettii]
MMGTAHQSNEQLPAAQAADTLLEFRQTGAMVKKARGGAQACQGCTADCASSVMSEKPQSKVENGRKGNKRSRKGGTTRPCTRRSRLSARNTPVSQVPGVGSQSWHTPSSSPSWEGLEVRWPLTYRMVNMRVKVSNDGCYKSGKIVKYLPPKGKHEILYDDGTVEVLDLDHRAWKPDFGNVPGPDDKATPSVSGPKPGRKRKAGNREPNVNKKSAKTDELGKPASSTKNRHLSAQSPVWIALSNVPRQNRQMLKDWCKSQPMAAAVGEVTSTTTHLVVMADENMRIERATEKYLKAILHGCYIVSWSWVEASMRQGCLVDEWEFIVKGDQSHEGGPQLGRRRAQRKEALLFAGLQFYLWGADAGNRKTVAKQLLELAGGQLLKRPPPRGTQLGSDSQVWVLTTGATNAKEMDSLSRRWGCRPLEIQWAYDSVAAHRILPTASYEVATDALP